MATVWFEGVEEMNRVAADLVKGGLRAGFLGQQVVAKTAHDIEASAKAFCPVDTGNLRNSIGTDIGRLQAAIGPTAKYGAYVEYGTARAAPSAYMGPALDRHSGAFVAAVGLIGQRSVFG
jgi:phage gpG-like protein